MPFSSSSKLHISLDGWFSVVGSSLKLSIFSEKFFSRIFTPSALFPSRVAQGGYFKFYVGRKKSQKIFPFSGYVFIVSFALPRFTLYNFESIPCRINRRVSSISFSSLRHCHTSSTHLFLLAMIYTVTNCFSSSLHLAPSIS